MRPQSISRRTALASGCLTLFTARGLFAEQLMLPTPPLTEGPFYPDRLPLDQDNDLLRIGDSLEPSVGEVTHLSGRVLTAAGSPITNATVEIWQCDANQVYLHTADSEPKAQQQDKNFQGFGRFETASSGEYRFRTIKPVPYPGRPAPHVHFKIKLGDREVLTTQLMIRGHAGNEQDFVFRNLRDPLDRELIVADFVPVPDSKLGEWSCRFDLVIGHTPDEQDLQRSTRS